METILANRLSKKYSDLLAVNSVSFSIDSEIYGLLGPNGSGKTTTVNMLTAMMTPTSGNAEVCGYDIRRQQKQIRECMSYVPQYIAADLKLTGRENVNLYAELYGIKNRSDRKKRVDEALEIMGLTDRADDRTKTYSGGMCRRLELAQALVHDPMVLFLDEPTVGLDVSARHSVWAHITKLKHRGITVFVTTHQLDEAERYCDRVGIIRMGNILREGKPADLTSSVNYIISISAMGSAPQTLVNKVDIIKDENGESIFVSDNPQSDLETILREYKNAGIRVFSSSMRKPTLEDIYLISINDGTEDIGMFDRNQYRSVMRRRS